MTYTIKGRCGHICTASDKDLDVSSWNCYCGKGGIDQVMTSYGWVSLRSNDRKCQEIHKARRRRSDIYYHWLDVIYLVTNEHITSGLMVLEIE